MKKLSLALAALALCGAANAGTAAANFTVSVSFTSACRAVSPQAVLAFGSYTAFAAPNTATANVGFECSRSTAITNVVIGGGVTTGLFPVAGLHYTLNLPSTTVAAANNGLLATTTSIGSADTLSVTVEGTLPSQAGTNNSGTPPALPEEVTRLMTITF